MIFPLFDHNPTHRWPLLTVLLIVVNIGVLVWMHEMPQQQQIDLLLEHGFIPKRLSEVDAAKPVQIKIEQPAIANQPARPAIEKQFPPDPPAVYLTLLSMMFLHGGWLHVMSNMWMLWVFGNNIEDRLGHFIFLGLYLAGGILAALMHWAMGPSSMTPTIGASGAVAAILGAYAVTYPAAKVKSLLFIGFPLLLELPALLVIAVWFVMELAMAFLQLENVRGAQVAYWAHVGGCLAGLVLMPILAVGTSPPDADWRGEAKELIDLGR